MKKRVANRASSSQRGNWVLPVVTLCLVVVSSVMFSRASHGQVNVQFGVSYNYSPPEWAPPYDNESTIRYYYLPDYDMYYDVWERQYYYLRGGVWIASYDLPPMWVDAPMESAFVVLIEPGIEHPWEHHDFYERNYPRHFHEHYGEIVTRNRIITNVRPEHDLVPRAYNEQNRRVTFMQHQRQEAQQGRGASPNQTIGGNAGEHQSQGQPQGQPQSQPAQAARNDNQRFRGNNGYHQQVHEVPMKSIAPSMPPESRKFNYGGGQNHAPRSNPAPAPPPAQARPQASQPARGNQGNGNQNNGNHGNGNQGNGNQGKDKHK